jgi:hypothetical protein
MNTEFTRKASRCHNAARCPKENGTRFSSPALATRLVVPHKWESGFAEMGWLGDDAKSVN